jgi:hypothetical protein
MKPSEFIKEELSTDDEYRGEVGMVKNNLHTIVRVSVHLAKELQNDEDLPEWVEEKISIAKGMMVTAMDYMISQHERGIQPTVAEDATGGGTSSGGIATSMGGGDGFGKSIFMSRKGPVKTKKTK